MELKEKLLLGAFDIIFNCFFMATSLFRHLYHGEDPHTSMIWAPSSRIPLARPPPTAAESPEQR